MNFTTPRAVTRPFNQDFPRWLVRLASTAGLAVAGLSLSLTAQAQVPQTIEGIFTNATSAPDWTLSGSRSGKPGMPSIDGSGWLRLTPVTAFAHGQIQANARIPSQVPVRVEFDYLAWGNGGAGRPADGLSIYFADASVANAGQGGEVGGGLGYCGMKGGYLGVGIDLTGNFTRWHCGLGKFNTPGPLLGTAKSGTPGQGNVVAVRGPQSSNYNYEGRTPLAPLDVCQTCTDRSKAINFVRHVVLDMAPRTPANSGYTLTVTVNGKETIKNMDFPYAPPAEFVMGLVGTTGAWASNHEIRNVKLSVQGSVAAANCFNGVNPQTGRCLPADNGLKNVDIYANVGSYFGLAPTELADGDLAQVGWNGATAYNGTNSKLANRACMQFGPQLPGTALVNQIVIVSRQDDWQNAIDPTPDMEFTKHGAVDFRVDYSTNHSTSWDQAPGGDVTGNNKVMRVFDLPKPELLTNLSVSICKTADDNTSPLVEILMREKK